MKRKIAIALGLAMAFGVGATALYANPYGQGPGWGMGGGMGWGPGHMMGYGSGQGYGMGPGYGMGRGMGFGHGPGFGPGATDNPGAFVENRLAALKSELKITPAQEGVWNAYVGQAKLQADSMRKWMITMHESTSASLPERSELHNQIWKQRQAHSETTAQTIKDLYAVLTAEQKPIADQLLGGFGPRAGGRMGYGYR